MFLSTVSIQSYHSVVKDFIIKTNITLFVVFTLLTVHGPESHRQVDSLDGLGILGPVECGRVCSVLSYGGDNYLNWAVQYIVHCSVRVHIQLV